MIATDKFKKLEIATAGSLWAWLEEHHGQAESIWLVTYKRAAGKRFVATGDVLDALVAYGWIDGVRRKVDDLRTMQLISPRRTQHWARTYKDRAARLIVEGRMQPAGQVCIDRCKADGLWSFMDDVDAGIVPDDLRAALQAHPPAERHFEAFAPSTRRNILRWIKLAKSDATRQKRITQTATLAARNEKVPQM